MTIQYFFAILTLVYACMMNQSVLANTHELLGQQAPDFVLERADGRQLHLAELQGQIVVLNVWASWCAPCREEMPVLEVLYQKYKQQGIVVVGVNIEGDTEKAIAFLRSQALKNSASNNSASNNSALSFPIIFDQSNQLTEQYAIDAIPMTFIIDRQGRVHAVHRGYKKGYSERYEQDLKQLLQKKSEV